MTALDILSDPICPWCYIGKSRLDRALAQRDGVPFEITWHPFQLNPDMPAEGMDRREYLETKFGGKENAIRVYGQIAETAEADGLEIDFAAIKRTPNTIDAHRVIHWAGIEELQGPVVDAMFAAYFREGRDIGDKDELATIAGQAGLDAAMIRQLLDGDSDVEEIRNRDAHSRRMGVNSVPTFVVGQRHAVPGAQPTDLWLKVIDEMTEATTA